MYSRHEELSLEFVQLSELPPNPPSLVLATRNAPLPKVGIIGGGEREREAKLLYKRFSKYLGGDRGVSFRIRGPSPRDKATECDVT